MILFFDEYFNQHKRAHNVWFSKGKEMQNHKEKLILSTELKSGFAQTLKFNTNAMVHKTLERWKMMPSDELWLIKLGVPCPSDMAARISPKNKVIITIWHFFTVFKIYRKSLILHCEQGELRLHFSQL